MKSDERRSKSDTEAKVRHGGGGGANSDSSSPPPPTTNRRKPPRPSNVEQRNSNSLKLPDDFSYLRNVRGKPKEKVDDRVRHSSG